MRKLLLVFSAVAAVLLLTVPDASSQQVAGAAKKGARKKGPAGPLPRQADGKPDLTGIWNGFGGSGNDAPNMQPWAASVVARHREVQGAEDYEARCLPGGPPRAAPYHTAFFATPKLVVMLFEGNTHMYRQFFVDGSDHPKNLKPTFYGDSRAHWDGDTLIVDSVSFFEKSWYDFAGTPHTEQMHVTEAFHRLDYGNMEMKVTIEDPGALNGPWVINRTTTLEPDFDMTEYVCNENNQDPEHLNVAYKLEHHGKPLTAGVPPEQPRKAPAPPTGATPKTADGKTDFAGVWVPTSTNLPSDPAYQPAFKKIYDERKAAKGKGDPEKYCLPNGAVRVSPLPMKLVQRPEMLLQLSEGNTHSFRRFFLDGRKPNLEIEPDSWTGLSNGRWEGDALVVDTVGFNDKTWLDSTGKPHSDAMHVTERYRRTDLGHLAVDYTIEDTKALAKPYSFTRNYTLAPGWELQEYVCQAVLDGVY